MLPVPVTNLPLPAQTEIKLSVSTSGDYTWSITLACDPGGEVDLLNKMDEMNAYVARRYRPMCVREPVE